MSNTNSQTKTFRSLLSQCNFDKVIDKLVIKFNTGISNNDDVHERDDVYEAFDTIRIQLLAKETIKSVYPIVIHKVKDSFDEESKEYIDVSLKNQNYNPPPTNALPWGGNGKDPIPEGFYDANDINAHEYLGFGDTSWVECVNAEVITECKVDIDTIVAEVLWELTFYGFEEDSSANFMKEMNEKFDAIEKSESESVRLIPLDDIFKKTSKKKTTKKTTKKVTKKTSKKVVKKSSVKKSAKKKLPVKKIVKKKSKKNK